MIPLDDLGKTFIRKTIKIAACPKCWDPNGKHPRYEECHYDHHCKECCEDLRTLPYNGFHHACQSLITSTPDTRKGRESAKRKHNPFDVGNPTDNSQVLYKPNSSETQNKRAKLLESLTRKRKEREEVEQAQAAAKAAAEAEADAAAPEDAAETEMEGADDKVTHPTPFELNVLCRRTFKKIKDFKQVEETELMHTTHNFS